MSRTTAQQAIADRGELPVNLLSLTTPKGTLLHLVDLDGDRHLSLCGRWLGVNPRYLYVGTWFPGVGPAEAATCTRCVKLAVG